jgi:hypothetical protein
MYIRRGERCGAPEWALLETAADVLTAARYDLGRVPPEGRASGRPLSRRRRLTDLIHELPVVP